MITYIHTYIMCDLNDAFNDDVSSNLMKFSQSKPTLSNFGSRSPSTLDKLETKLKEHKKTLPEYHDNHDKLSNDDSNDDCVNNNIMTQDDIANNVNESWKNPPTKKQILWNKPEHFDDNFSYQTIDIDSKYKLLGIHCGEYTKLTLALNVDQFLKYHSILYDIAIEDIDYDIILDSIKNRYIMDWIDNMFHKLSNGLAGFRIKTYYTIDNMERFVNFINNFNDFFDETQYCIRPIFRSNDNQIVQSVMNDNHMGHFMKDFGNTGESWSEQFNSIVFKNGLANGINKDHKMLKSNFGIDGITDGITDGNTEETIYKYKADIDNIYLYYNHFTYKFINSEYDLKEIVLQTYPEIKCIGNISKNSVVIDVFKNLPSDIAYDELLKIYDALREKAVVDKFDKISGFNPLHPFSNRCEIGVDRSNESGKDADLIDDITEYMSKIYKESDGEKIKSQDLIEDLKHVFGSWKNSHILYPKMLKSAGYKNKRCSDGMYWINIEAVYKDENKLFTKEIFESSKDNEYGVLNTLRNGNNTNLVNQYNKMVETRKQQISNNHTNGLPVQGDFHINNDPIEPIYAHTTTQIITPTDYLLLPELKNILLKPLVSSKNILKNVSNIAIYSEITTSFEKLVRHFKINYDVSDEWLQQYNNIIENMPLINATQYIKCIINIIDEDITNKWGDASVIRFSINYKTIKIDSIVKITDIAEKNIELPESTQYMANIDSILAYLIENLINVIDSEETSLLIKNFEACIAKIRIPLHANKHYNLSKIVLDFVVSKIISTDTTFSRVEMFCNFISTIALCNVSYIEDDMFRKLFEVTYNYYNKKTNIETECSNEETDEDDEGSNNEGSNDEGSDDVKETESSHNISQTVTKIFEDEPKHDIDDNASNNSSDDGFIKLDDNETHMDVCFINIYNDNEQLNNYEPTSTSLLNKFKDIANNNYGNILKYKHSCKYNIEDGIFEIHIDKIDLSELKNIIDIDTFILDDLEEYYEKLYNDDL